MLQPGYKNSLPKIKYKQNKTGKMSSLPVIETYESTYKYLQIQ